MRAHIEHCDRCRTELLGWLSAAPGMPVGGRAVPSAASPAGVLISYARPKPDERPAPLPCAISGTGEGSGGGRSEDGRTRIFKGEAGGSITWPRDAAPSPHCLSEELLVAYSEGDSRGAEAVPAEQHLLHCASCVGEVQRLIALRIAIGEPTPDRAAELQAALATTGWAGAARIVPKWVGQLREWLAALGAVVRQAPAFSAVALAALGLVVGAQLLSRGRDAAEFHSVESATRRASRCSRMASSAGLVRRMISLPLWCSHGERPEPLSKRLVSGRGSSCRTAGACGCGPPSCRGRKRRHDAVQTGRDRLRARVLRGVPERGAVWRSVLPRGQEPSDYCRHGLQPPCNRIDVHAESFERRGAEEIQRSRRPEHQWAGQRFVQPFDRQLCLAEEAPLAPAVGHDDFACLERLQSDRRQAVLRNERVQRPAIDPEGFLEGTTRIGRVGDFDPDLEHTHGAH